ncbi:RISC-loading complex subunit TARBP2 [Monomorium pharaonis]|uniref:RISC-loading complex subunit TARBP2 n=1 Tax=Monomorium pharaonis TaxID=307658 RepID=UPI00063EF1C8|nr:RISC-loading complex subunit TARBP2 [Monomorium pharaonis]XP_012535179.1 RISC-loading complex subunit TARBP2 [Monomorium pharaonis]XP_012535188.1 RISC-loading complex subunit TARBP2 [Monomorium pharaonis]XP_028047730.1 RISC-loading complex subunit TARBP2 [Monomorium pharaonis]
MSKTPVSILQEMMVKQNMIPDYELIHDGGGRHVNTFTYRVSCDGLSATGTGRCKKDAKHEAAKAMLSEIAAHRNYPQLPAASTPTVSPSTSPFHSASLPPKISASVPFFNAVGELQELCAINNLQEPEYILIKDIGPPHARIFTLRCKVSNFEEDGIATTKKQAKHDAAKKMVDRIKSLVIDSSFYKERSEEESLLNSSIKTIDIELMNKNAEERYHALTKTRKVNLGLKLAEYHNNFKNSLEIDKRNNIVERLQHIFSNNFFGGELFQSNITIESLTEKTSELETILSEIDVTMNIKDMVGENQCFMTAIELNTSPLITQIGMGKNKLEASWKALAQVITSLKVLLL